MVDRLRNSGLLVLLLALPALLAGQEEPPPDVWKPLRVLVGSWEGTGTGRWGDSTVEREYRFVLRGAYLRGSTKSVYPPQEKNPEGEVHEEFSFYSYDRRAGKFMLRQFSVEKIVNRYVQEEISPDGKTLVFRTESIENFRPGWRARETIKIVSDDEFIEIFELAPPEQDLQEYLRNHFHRKK